MPIGETGETLALDIRQRRLLISRHLAERNKPVGGGIDVHAYDMVGSDPGHVRCDEGAEVAALNPVARIAQCIH